MQKALKVIKQTFSDMGLQYFLMEAKGAPSFPYFVGEFYEAEVADESGLHNSEFTVTGYGRGSWKELEEAKDQIRAAFHPIIGKTAIDTEGNAVAIYYGSSQQIPTQDAELKKIEITLAVKEWSK